MARFPVQLFMVAGVLFAGCVEDPTTGEISLAVEGGSTTRLFPAVGFLENTVAGSRCGATLIGERTLLTAAHCLNRDLRATEVDLVRPNEIRFYPVYDATNRSSSGAFVADELLPHREFAGGGVNDIAVVRLRRAPSASIKRLPIATRAPAMGEQVSILGYGSPRLDRRQIATNTVFEVKATTFEIRGSGNICDGDSGSSTLVQRGAEHLVLGVHSGRIGACGQRGIDTRVDAYVGWIQEQAGDDVLLGADATEPTDPADDDDDPADDPGATADDEAVGCAAAGGQGAGGLGLVLAALAGVRRRRT